MSRAESVRDILTWLNRHEFRQTLSFTSLSSATLSNAKIGDTGGDSFERPFHIDGDAIHATYAGLQLGTLFQPIVRGSTPVAHEAQLTFTSPPHRFSSWQPADSPLPIDRIGSQDAHEIVYFDRLVRTLHSLNFLIQDATGDLHLNVDAHHLLAVTENHGQVFEQIVRQCGLAPDRFVLEIPEHAIRDKDRLRDAIAAWQSRRYRIAVDGFGQQHAQLARVLGLRPDILKIDANFWQRQLVTAAGQKKLVDTLQRIIDRGIAVVLTGVDAGPLPVAIAPLVAAQGTWIGAPEPECRQPTALHSQSPNGHRPRFALRA